jgi:hypothetical protein
MRINEIILESFSLTGTVRAIAGDINGTVPTMFGEMRVSLDKYIGVHKSVDKFPFVRAGIFERWKRSVYLNRLESEIKDLNNFLPKNIDKRPPLGSKFADLRYDLPNELIQLGNILKNDDLIQAGKTWAKHCEAYFDYEQSMEAKYGDEVKKNKRGDSYKEKNQVDIETQRDNIIQQRNQVDAIVNDTLSKLPKNIRGDVRNAIARSTNKLAALEAELLRRNIKL